MVRFATASLLCAALLAASAASAAFVPPPYLVRDIGDTVPSPRWDYFYTVRPMEGSGEVAYFYQDDGIHGAELWRSDGTSAGTHMVRDICPGACGAEEWLPSTQALALVGNNAVFTADDGVHGVELWWTDGTDAGTHMIADLAPGTSSSRFGNFTGSTQLAFFTCAPDGHPPFKLWRSDGSAAGTFPLVDNVDGVAMLANGSTLYFGGPTGGLWKSDGTVAGTFPLAAGFVVGQSAGFAGAPFRFLPNGWLVFGATLEGDPYSWQLWVSDGTAAGTHPLHDSATGEVIYGPGGFFLVGSQIFLAAETCPSGAISCLWRTDGTDAGTHAIPAPADLTPQFTSGGAASVGSRLLFAGFTSAEGTEPWVTDGVTTQLLLAIRPGLASGIPEFFQGESRWFASVGSRAAFLANDGVHGLEVWSTDGTTLGTEPLPELVPGPGGVRREVFASFQRPVELGELALLRYRDAAGTERLAGIDGSLGEAAQIAVVSGATNAFYYPPEIYYLREFRDLCFGAINDRFFFSASDSAAGNELWTTTGDESETLREADLNPGIEGSYPQSCGSPDGSVLLFSANESLVDPQAFFRLDESSLGPEEVLASSVQLDPVPIGDRLFGLAWSSDGTGPLGTFLTDGSAPGTVFLSSSANGGLGIEHLSTSSGVLVASDVLDRLDEAQDALEYVGGGSGDLDFLGPLSLAQVGNTTLFIATQQATGSEIWRTDGTPEGTGLLLDIGPGTRSGVPGFWDQTVAQRLTPLGSRALFAGDDGVHGLELWTTDGTALGTVMVADLYPGAYPSSPKLLTPLGNRVYFVAEHPTLGQEVWVTDGTAAGTHVLADLAPGAASSVPLELAAQGGRLYFSAWTPATGREAWIFDPTGPSPNPQPTLVADIAPGALSSSPFHFTQVGPRLYFVANDNSRGFELWALPDAAFALLFEDGFDSGNTSRWSASAP